MPTTAVRSSASLAVSTLAPKASFVVALVVSVVVFTACAGRSLPASEPPQTPGQTPGQTADRTADLIDANAPTDSPTARSAGASDGDAPATDVEEAAAVAEPAPAPAPPEPEPMNCTSATASGDASAGPSSPLALSADDLARRHGTDVTALADLSTSLAQPVEVCGIHGQHAFMLAATCADGTQPFERAADVLKAWRGAQGVGGRCGKMVDMYEVKCKDQSHAVYMDMYFCGGDESFTRPKNPGQ